MSDREPEKEIDSGALVRVLTAHFRSLTSAKCDETLLKQYSALLRFLRSGKGRFLDNLDERGHHSEPTHPTRPTLNEDDLRRSSLNDIAKLVSDEATPRKELEYIAIKRFSVPRGSMRSFSNKRMLVDKLLTLIGNERAHETIGAVARGDAKGVSDL